MNMQVFYMSFLQTSFYITDIFASGRLFLSYMSSFARKIIKGC
jgi:hypothetical protein